MSSRDKASPVMPVVIWLRKCLRVSSSGADIEIFYSSSDGLLRPMFQRAALLSHLAGLTSGLRPRCSAGAEEVAGQALDDEAAQAEALLLYLLVDAVDGELVGRLHEATGAIGEQLADEVAGELFLAGVV